MGHLRPDSVILVIAVSASPALPVSRVLAYAFNMCHLIHSSKQAQALCLPSTSPWQPRWTGSIKVIATLPTRPAGSGQVDVLCLRKVETSTIPTGYPEDPPVYLQFAPRSHASDLTPRIPALPAAFLSPSRFPASSFLLRDQPPCRLLTPGLSLPPLHLPVVSLGSRKVMTQPEAETLLPPEEATLIPELGSED